MHLIIRSWSYLIPYLFPRKCTAIWLSIPVESIQNFSFFFLLLFVSIYNFIVTLLVYRYLIIELRWNNFKLKRRLYYIIVNMFCLLPWYWFKTAPPSTVTGVKLRFSLGCTLRFGHENVSTTILSLPLIQEGQLSVTGERIGTNYL